MPQSCSPFNLTVHYSVGTASAQVTCAEDLPPHQKQNFPIQSVLSQWNCFTEN